MEKFTHLFNQIDRTTKTNKKVGAMVEYFSDPIVSSSDKLWAVFFLSGNKLRQPVNRTLLKEWAADVADIPLWLFKESYNAIADLAETITLLVPDNKEQGRNKSLTSWTKKLRSLHDVEDLGKKEGIVKEAWKSLPQNERFIYNKLITGAFRVGVSQKLVYRSIAKTFEVEEDEVAFRLSGNWHPDDIKKLDDLLFSDEVNISKPYPFALAYQIDKELHDLGGEDQWSAEWKWDGIRGQIVKREGEVFIWSRGEELVTGQFPELVESARDLPDGIAIDGEILVYRNGEPALFNDLQARLGRKNVSKKLIESNPVHFFSYDLLELRGRDIRDKAFTDRRRELEKILTDTLTNVHLSEQVNFTSWDELQTIRDEARARQAEGIMLKRNSSPYFVGRKKGDWWKWKVDPFTLDMVLLYAARGSGRRATLYTDYTLGVWDTSEGSVKSGRAVLVPLAKAYSGLTDKELAKIDKFIKKNTRERFGPVRTVKPELVFEIAFEGIAPSTRHKSGLAVRFPRILRQRIDKPLTEAGTLQEAYDLLHSLQYIPDNN